MCCNSAGFTVVHLFEDLVDSFGPNKWFGILIVRFDVILDGLDQVFHAFESATTNPFSGDFAKPPLHQI